MSELRYAFTFDRQGPWLLVATVVGAVAAGLIGLGGLSPLAAIGGLIGFVLAAILVLAVLAEPERGLWLMLIATPLDTAGRIITSPVTITVFHLTLLLTILAWTLRWVVDPDDGRPRWSAIDLGIAMLLAAAVWSLPGSLAPAATVTSTIRLVFMWVFFLAYVTWLRSERSLHGIVVLIVVTASLSAGVAVVQSAFPAAGIGYVHVQMGFDSLTYRPAAFFDDPNYLGTLLSLAILAAIGLAISARKVRHSLLWLLPAALCSWGMVVTLSRTAWLGVIAGIFVLVLAAPKDRRRWLIGALVLLTVMVAVAAPDATLSRLASFADYERDTSIRTRVLMLDSTVDMIADNWVFGTGLSAYEVAYPPYRRLGALMDIWKPHQLPLALWAEMGLPGLFAQLLLVGGVVWMVRTRRHRGWNVYESIGVAGLISVLAQSLFQYYLYFQYLWLFLALTAVATRLPASTKGGNPMTMRAAIEVLKMFFRRQWLIMLGATLVAAAVGYVVVGERPDTYMAQSTIRIDSSALRRFTGLTGPEALLDSVRGVEFVEQAAERVGVSTEEFEEGVYIYTAGVPIAMYVEVTDEESDTAERLAAEVAAFVVQWQDRLSILDLGKQRILVKESRHTLEFLEGVPMESGWEETDLEFKLWNVRRDLATNDAILLSMENVYVVHGEPVIEEFSGVRERQISMLGAGLVGLFFGFVVAAARERRIRGAA